MTNSISDFAKLTLTRLAELSLSPTPENYAKYYYEISGEPAPLAPKGQSCAEIMQIVESVLHDVTNRTAGLANDLGVQNQGMRKSIEELKQVQEHAEIFRLLELVIAQANIIQGTVENSRNDFLSTKHSIDVLSQELQEARLQLNEDALTGAQNRRSMDTILFREVSRAIRIGSKLCVAMIDIDHFKRVNDKHGHDAGDKLLLHITLIAKSVLRDADVLVRYGGEEFLLILPDTDIQGAEFVLTRLRQVIAKSPLIYEAKKISVTFSGGIAQFAAGENAQGLVLRADSALYAAKNAGRDCFLLAKT